MRTTSVTAALLLALLAAPGSRALLAQDGADVADPATKPAPSVVTAEQRDAAIRRGFHFLDEEMWKLSEGGSPQKQYTIAVAGMASLLAQDRVGDDAGKLPSRKRELARARDYVVRYAGEVSALYERDAKKKRKKDKKRKSADSASGLPGMPGGFGTPSQYVWPLGVGGLFLAESAKRGSGKRDAVAGLREIVTVLAGAQQDDGGWGHDDARRPGMGLPPIKIPKPGGGMLTYPDTLLAASNGALTSLALGESVAGAKSGDAIERGRRFFAASQHDGGAWPYDPSQRVGAGSEAAGDLPPEIVERLGSIASALDVARSGGAVFALLSAGATRTDATVARGLAVIDAHPEWAGEGHGSASLAFQWSALLAKARGPETWSIFKRHHFARIIEQQQKDGSFDCACRKATFGVTCDTESIGGGTLPGMGSWDKAARVYVTAIHTLILLLDRSDLESVPEMPGLAAEVTPR